MKDSGFTPYPYVCDTFEKVLSASTADETELVWFERKYAKATYPAKAPNVPSGPPRLTVLIRVIEGGRQGWYRTETSDPNLLESGIRQALALAKVQTPVKKRPVLPTNNKSIKLTSPLLDRELSDLSLKGAERLLQDWLGQGMRGELSWSETRLAIFNSHGLRRNAATTELTLKAEAVRGTVHGYAAGSARSLKSLEPQEICARAKSKADHGQNASLPTKPIPVLLAPEVTVELLNLLNTFALAGRSYLDGTSFLSQHRNVQVFDRILNLRDDGNASPGVPFPFDLEGSPKRSLDLIVKGQPSTPALNRYQSVKAGLKPTAQAVGGQDALFGNLFLLPDQTSQADLLAAADGGIYVGWIDSPECFEPSQLRFRAKARNLRLIEGGRLGGHIADTVWEESLLQALARLRAIGRSPVVRVTPTTPLGAISAPALVLAESEGFLSTS